MPATQEINSEAILPVTLAAIVRDEKMNSAGGVKRWLDSTLPYVAAAVVIDTGSTDGTIRSLMEAREKYPHLDVFSHKWQGFADARNRSLEEAKKGDLYKSGKEHILILDADEIIVNKKSIKRGYEKTWEFIQQHPFHRYHFPIDNVFFPGEKNIETPSNGIRLLTNCDMHYFGLHLERLCDLGCGMDIQGARIKHFLPAGDAIKKKSALWYCHGEESFSHMPFMTVSPAESAKEHGWKEYNQKRDRFK